MAMFRSLFAYFNSRFSFTVAHKFLIKILFEVANHNRLMLSITDYITSRSSRGVGLHVSGVMTEKNCRIYDKVRHKPGC